MNGSLGGIANGATIPDTGGYGNNGIMVYGTAQYVAGPINNGIQLNGSYISVPNSASQQVTHVDQQHLDQRLAGTSSATVFRRGATIRSAST